jgi:hypothetical protein
MVIMAVETSNLGLTLTSIAGSYSSQTKEVIAARNAKDAHAQDFMANDSCYYPSWQHLHIARPHYYCTGYSKFLIFSVCIVAQLSVATTNSSSLVPTTVALSPAQSQTTPRGVHLLFTQLYLMHYYNTPAVMHEISQIFYKVHYI